MKRNHDLAVAFVLAVALHGLALFLTGLIPGRLVEKAAGDEVAVVRDVEVLLPAPVGGEPEMAPVERTLPAEPRTTMFNDSVPEVPDIPVQDTQRLQAEARPSPVAKVSAQWVDLPPETATSPAAGVGGHTEGAEKRVRPELAGGGHPRYPFAARLRGEEGRVTVRMRVDAGGVARDARVTKSSGYGDLDRTALEAVGKATFRPAQQGGRPVEAECELVFEFRLEEYRKEKP